MPPFVGEIRMFGGNFAPAGWELCNGQLIPISENDVLFQLIGTTYGGDGQSTFALPNLQSRVPVHVAGPQNYQLGQSGGVEQVTLTTQQIPNHSHPVVTAAASGTTNVPGGTTIMADMGPAGVTKAPGYRPFDGANQVALNSQSIASSGGSQPHDNMQPYLVINYIISMFGFYPSQN